MAQRIVPENSERGAPGAPLPPAGSASAEGGQTVGGARSCIGPSFEWCGWKADITAENKSELLSVCIKDSWERDLLPVLPV